MSPELSFDQKLVHEQHQQTEVLDRLSGMDSFLDSIKERLILNPNEATQISLVGETGVGKSVIAAQVILNLESDETLRSALAEKGKRLKVWHISLARCLALLKERGIITSDWGNFTPEEYARNSYFMADLLNLAENNMLQDSGVVPLIVFDAVSVTEYVDRGFFVMKSKSKDPNHNVLAIVTDHRVASETGEIRDFLWDTDDPVEFMKILREHNITLDKEIETKAELEEFRFAMGNKKARERIRKEINDGAWRAKDELKETNCPEFTLEELQNATKAFEELQMDSQFLRADAHTIGLYLERVKELRSEVIYHYYTYLIKKVWGVTDGNFLVTKNTFIQERDINYYVRILEEHTLPIEKVIQDSEIFKFSRTILNGVSKSADRVD